MRPMTDWGGYTRGSFTPASRPAFSDVVRQASPAYVVVQTPAGPTSPNGMAKSIAGHRYGNHRWTDPYQPPIPAYQMPPQNLTAANATTDPTKLNRLRGFTDTVPAVTTSMAQILAKNSTGQY